MCAKKRSRSNSRSKDVQQYVGPITDTKTSEYASIRKIPVPAKYKLSDLSDLPSEMYDDVLKHEENNSDTDDEPDEYRYCVQMNNICKMFITRSDKPSRIPPMKHFIGPVFVTDSNTQRKFIVSNYSIPVTQSVEQSINIKTLPSEIYNDIRAFYIRHMSQPFKKFMVQTSRRSYMLPRSEVASNIGMDIWN